MRFGVSSCQTPETCSVGHISDVCWLNPENDDEGEQEGIQGGCARYARYLFSFYLLTNSLFPQPQPVSLYGKCADVPPLAPTAHPIPLSPTNLTPTIQTIQTLEHALMTRTCPCGQALVFPLPSLVSNTRMCPQGHILVFRHYFLPLGHEECDTGVRDGFPYPDISAPFPAPLCLGCF